jgi:hypothetical protein
VFDQPAGDPGLAGGGPGGPRPANCLIVSDHPDLAAAVGGAARAAGMTPLGGGALARGFAAATEALARAGEIDALVVAPRSQSSPDASSWQELLQAHRGTGDDVVVHAAWLRAAYEQAQRTGRPIRVVHLADATSPAGRSGAQAVAQLARSVNETPSSVDIDAFAVSVETTGVTDDAPIAQLVARLLRADDTRALRGAELVARPGWIGLRSHPSPSVTVSFGGPAIPAWVSGTVRELIGSAGRSEGDQASAAS